MPEVESRTQDSRPRPGTQKKSEAKAKDSPCEDRPSWGQGQECSRPRPRTKDTGANVLQKKSSIFFQALSKKNILQNNFFRRSPKQQVFKIIFQAIYKIFTIQKVLLSSSRGQGNFRGLEASRLSPRTWPSRPRTSRYVPKDVLKDSTSGKCFHSENNACDSFGNLLAVKPRRLRLARSWARK